MSWNVPADSRMKETTSWMVCKGHSILIPCLSHQQVIWLSDSTGAPLPTAALPGPTVPAASPAPTRPSRLSTRDRRGGKLVGRELCGASKLPLFSWGISCLKGFAKDPLGPTSDFPRVSAPTIDTRGSLGSYWPWPGRRINLDFPPRPNLPPSVRGPRDKCGLQRNEMYPVKVKDPPKWVSGLPTFPRPLDLIFGWFRTSSSLQVW